MFFSSIGRRCWCSSFFLLCETSSVLTSGEAWSNPQSYNTIRWISKLIKHESARPCIRPWSCFFSSHYVSRRGRITSSTLLLLTRLVILVGSLELEVWNWSISLEVKWARPLITKWHQRTQLRWEMRNALLKTDSDDGNPFEIYTVPWAQLRDLTSCRRAPSIVRERKHSNSFSIRLAACMYLCR